MEFENRLKNSLIAFTRIAAIIFLIIAVCVSILLIINYLQLKVSNPINSPALEKLINKLKENPQDEELKEEIRELDLIARKAFFTKEWQIKITTVILIISALLFFLSAKIYFSLNKQHKKPQKADGNKINDDNVRAGIIIVILGIIIISTSIIIAYSTNSIMKNGFSFNSKSKSNKKSNVLKEQFWSSFRGPLGNAAIQVDFKIKDFNGLTGEGILWKSEIPRAGFNSPIVRDNRLFISGGDDEDIEIYSYDTQNGNLLWRKSIYNYIDKKELPEVSEDTGYTASTLATDGTYVCGIFATGDIICIDFNGSSIWTKNLGVPDNIYGHSSSLIIFNNILYVQYDHGSGAKIFALDVKTGNIIWEKERDVLTSWSSPIIAMEKNKPALVLNGNPYVIAYDLNTGDELWSVECMMGEVAPSPAYADGMVYAANQYAVCVCIDNNTGTIVWENMDDLPDVSSPLATKDYLILATSYGVVVCFDAKKGEVLWTNEFENGFYSSPVLVGENVFLIDKQGVLYVFKADKKYNEVGRYNISESIVSVPAFTEKKMFIRGEKFLYCIGE